ncbi:MAG: hypothetical protein KF884_08940 [Fimbriimonadaceae bacterium]|nr:hypothetical protein [Fimbriimonadaceae bacterium]QYK57675.1 MAG: hypothetical protein KF884_08940 [Fimbriimonadaceae bacterium]
MRRIGILAGAALLALAWGAQDRPFIRDRQGKFALYGVPSSSAEFLEGGKIKFAAQGSPARGFSKDQGLEFRARSVSGLIAQPKGQSMRLESGSAQGDVWIQVVRGEGTSVVTGSRIDLNDDGQNARMVSPGPFKFKQTTQVTGGKRDLDLSGASGVFTLEALGTKSDQPLVGAEIRGPVRAELVASAADGRGTYVVKGDRATYSRSDRTLRVVGNVVFEGTRQPKEGAGFEGEMFVDRLTVVFNEKFEVVRVLTEGSPGSGAFKEPGQR